MNDTYRAMLIKDGLITPLDLRREGWGARHIHEIMDDTFCQCFAVRSPPNRLITGFCDDNFTFKDLPLNILLSSDLYDAEPPGYPIHGPIVIAAHNSRGETVDMTTEERARFFIVNGALRYAYDTGYL